MSNRRRRQQNDVDGLFGGIILAAMLLATYFQSNPIITSISCAGIATLSLIGGLWLRQRATTRTINRVTGRQMYLDYTPHQFEKAVAELFRAQGYHAKLTPGSGDGGLDILLSKDGEQYGVECKQYKDTLGPKFIRDFIGALQLRKLKAGFFVTTSGYSEQARLSAKNSEYQIQLIDGEMLGRWQRQLQQRVEMGQIHHTAFIPFPWWPPFSRAQKATIVTLLMVTTFVVTFALVYAIGLNVSG